MAVTAWAGQGAATFAFASTQHESSITGFREVLATQGGQSLELADGTIIQTVTKATVVAVEVDCVPSLAAADLWRYLRETTSTTGTITIGLTASLTESATNPEHVYTVTGWARPALDYTAGQTKPMTARFTVTGNPTVDVT
jgi:hypothetical protein